MNALSVKFSRSLPLTILILMILVLLLTMAILVTGTDAQGGGTPTQVTYLLPRLLIGHKDAVKYTAFSGDGKTVATGGGREVLVWDVATNTLRQTITIDDYFTSI